VIKVLRILPGQFCISVSLFLLSWPAASIAGRAQSVTFDSSDVGLRQFAIAPVQQRITPVSSEAELQRSAAGPVQQQVRFASSGVKVRQFAGAPVQQHVRFDTSEIEVRHFAAVPAEQHVGLISSEAGLQQSPNSQTHRSVRFDSSEVTVRHFPEDALAAFLDDPEFDYRQRPAKPQLLQRVWSWIIEKLSHYLPEKPLAIGLKILPYLIIIAFVVFVVSRIFKTNISGLFFPTGESVPGLKDDGKSAESDDIRTAIDAAIAEKAYRQAVRLFFVYCLRGLSSRGFIGWQPEKTNRDYLLELKERDLMPAFRELVRWFEYVWYGQIELNEQQFEQVMGKFRAFEDKLMLRRSDGI
jgi:hypothetical protein